MIFNWKVYIQNYPDIQAAGIETQEQAINHWKRHGRNENRTDKIKGISLLFKEQTKINKITIITPCSRPNNIKKIIDSINFDYIDEWIIVYDGSKITSFEPMNEFNEKIKQYIYTDLNGISGNPQRNYGLLQVKNPATFIYFLDDDNIIHPDLYKLLNNIEPGNIYTFNQLNRLNGNQIQIGKIDTAMFLFDFSLNDVKEIKWVNNDYMADGQYILNIYNLHKNKWIYVNNINCYYNFLN